MEEIVTHLDKIFTGVNYSEKKMRNREFITCEFVNCDFTKSDLVGNSFEDCTFKQCNFTMANVDGTGFRNTDFIGCKMLGIDFTRYNKFAFSFTVTDCQLDYSNFYGVKLRKTVFKNCTLKEVEFTEADLTSCEFISCDLFAAKFSNTILEKTDFRTAQNFAIDPSVNKMKKARFSAFNLEGLLLNHGLDIDHNVT